jgi:hypothetical protein
LFYGSFQNFACPIAIAQEQLRIGEINLKWSVVGIYVTGFAMPFERRLQIADQTKYGADMIERRCVALLRTRRILQACLGAPQRAAGRIEFCQPRPGCCVSLVQPNRGFKGTLRRCPVVAREGNQSRKVMGSTHLWMGSKHVSTNACGTRQVASSKGIESGLQFSLGVGGRTSVWLVGHLFRLKKRVPENRHPFLHACCVLVEVVTESQAGCTRAVRSDQPVRRNAAVNLCAGIVHLIGEVLDVAGQAPVVVGLVTYAN